MMHCARARSGETLGYVLDDTLVPSPLVRARAPNIRRFAPQEHLGTVQYQLSFAAIVPRRSSVLCCGSSGVSSNIAWARPLGFPRGRCFARQGRPRLPRVLGVICVRAYVMFAVWSGSPADNGGITCVVCCVATDGEFPCRSGMFAACSVAPAAGCSEPGEHQERRNTSHVTVRAIHASLAASLSA